MGCFSERKNKPIILDANKDTTFVVESNGNDFINFRYNVEGYVQDSVSIEVSDFKKAKGNENVKLTIPLKAGKVEIKNGMWDFYAQKALVEFKHLDNKKGKLIIKAEI